MKKKKKIFILSDGRIFFTSVIPFFKKNSILMSNKDSFSYSNWVLNLNPFLKK